MARKGYLSEAEDMLAHDGRINRAENGELSAYAELSIRRMALVHGFGRAWIAGQFQVTEAEIDKVLEKAQSSEPKLR